MSQTFSTVSESARRQPGGRGSRRSTNHLREDITEGIEVYLDERRHATSVRRCGTVSREPFGKAWADACAVAAAHGAYPAFPFFHASFVRPMETILQ